MRIADKPLDVRAMAYGMIHPLGEIGHRAAATTALFAMGTVLGPDGPYRGEVHDLTGLSPERWKLCQGRPAIPAKLRAQVHHMVGVGHHFQGVPLASGLPTGLPSRFLAEALVLFRTVLVLGRRDRTVAAVLGALGACQALAQLCVFLHQLGYLP